MTEIYHQINNCMPSNKVLELTKAGEYHEEMLVQRWDVGKGSAIFFIIASVIMSIQVVVSMVIMLKCQKGKKV